MTIKDMIDKSKNMKCTECGGKYGGCDCWIKCPSCERHRTKEEKCANPKCPEFGGEERPLRAMATGTITLRI